MITLGGLEMNFSLMNQNEEMINLDSKTGKKIVFFYPKASTAGWAKEAAGFGESYDEFKALGINIYGVSKDTIKRQSNFAKKLETAIDLLSDAETTVCEDFGVWQLKKMCGKEYMGIVRSTFILDEDGTILKEWRKVKVAGHVEEVLEACKSL